jgi:transcription elongation factor Elf1
MVNNGDLQFAERIMVARRSEMSAEWKVRFAICIASVAIQAFTKLENMIYLLKCAICGLQYIGETKQQLSKRLNGHRSDANCKPDLPLSRLQENARHSVEYILWANRAKCMS